MKYFIIISFLIYAYFIINVPYYKTEYYCSTTRKTNNIKKIVKNIMKVKRNISSKRKYITFIYKQVKKMKKIKNIDEDMYSLLLIDNVFLTNRIIIQNCKIIMFNGQCKDEKWYSSNLINRESVYSISSAISLINWHSDGVFHGTIEGLTRIVPYIDYLTSKKYIYIIISNPRYKQNTAEKLLMLLGFSKSRILYGKLYIKNLYIPTPFYCVETSTPLLAEFSRILRSKMISKKCSISKIKFILIIQRSKNRIINDIDYLKEELIANFNYTVIVYNDTNSNLEEIYCWFTYASIVIGYHGSGLTNIYFCKENTTIIELSPVYPIYAFAKIGMQLGLFYYIYRLSYEKLYIKNIMMNISEFMTTLTNSNIIN